MLRILILVFAAYLVYMLLKRFFQKTVSSNANQFNQNRSFHSQRKSVDDAAETDFIEVDSKIKSDQN